MVPTITALGHGTHYSNNEISFPPPPTPRKTPHTSYITDMLVESQPEDGTYIGPKHVVVFLLFLLTTR